MKHLNPSWVVSAFMVSCLQSPYVLALEAKAGGDEAWLTVGIGDRRDHMIWSISALDFGINVLSELEWRAMASQPLELDLQLQVNDKLDLVGALVMGEYHDGHLRDSDYCGADRTLEFSRSRTEGDGDFLEMQGGLSYRVLSFDAFFLNSMLGYTLRQQDFDINQGVQIVGDSDVYFSEACILTDATGPTSEDPGPVAPGTPLTNLNTAYTIDWSGPWVGLQAGMDDGQTFLSWKLKYSLIEYEGEGYWRRRGLRFSHFADGSGFDMSLFAGFSLNASTQLGISADYHYMDTGRGDEVIYAPFCSNNLPRCVLPNEFNGGSTKAVNLAVKLRMAL